MFGDYYQGKRVLVTGHSGFKGGWLSLWLKELGAKVLGISLAPSTAPNLYEVVASHALEQDIICDIRDSDRLARQVESLKPDVIFHLAAQPIVRLSYESPLETFQTNALGTAHLLEAVRRAGLGCVVVIITSDKCYENREWEFAYRENDPLGGHDVYSMSKAATELVAQSWRRSFFQPDPRLGPLATARAGNVIGGGDYAPDRIVPDCVRALIHRQPILVRNPLAIRPWQHVLECLSGYLWLAASLAREGKTSALAGAFNFGPEPSSRQPVRRLVEEILRVWPGSWVDGSRADSPHEARLLALTIDKAAAMLGWRPCWDFEEAIQHTVAWYHQRHVINHSDMLQFSITQLRDYVQTARRKNLIWTQPS